VSLLLPPADTPEERLIRVADGVAIPLAELKFQFARSHGPGGQHVNKSETQVELTFDLLGSPSLSDEHKDRIRRRLGTRVDGDGVLHVTSSATRSQLRNREEAVARFEDLIRRALSTPRPRRRTRPTAASRERRLEQKRRRALLKQTRRE
jgi:ribosome-associated protein